jgi:hypothetical protein
MATPDPSQVAPWYLRNITQALALDETTGNVYVRTGFTGNIVIEGNVNIPGTVTVDSTPENPVHVHVDEIGTSGILNVPYMPIGNTNVAVTGGNITVTGNVGIVGNIAGITGNVTVNPVTGNVGIVGNVNVTQGTTPWSVAGNVQVTNPANAVVTENSTYYMNVAQGLVDSQLSVFKNGYATGLSQGVEATVWSQGTVYPWGSWTSAQRLYVSSSSASDTAQTIYINGLDSSYNTISESITTNGTTPVQTTGTYLRINQMYIVTGNTNVGTITTYLGSPTGTIVGGIPIGLGRAKQSVYTVPNGYTAYILYGTATQFRGGSGNIGGTVRMWIRTPDGTPNNFILQYIAECVNGQFRDEFIVPLRVPQHSDIDIRVLPDGNATSATVAWQMILIPN